MNTIELDVNEVIEYENNPRKITELAIEAVAESIERYGYQQPIVVDPNNVIIVGHTRLAAVKKLGWKKVTVMVADLPDEKARAYRLVDNKTSEMTTWDHNSLVMELREFEISLIEKYFPDVNLEIEQISSANQVTQDQYDEAAQAITQVREQSDIMAHATEVDCPSCSHVFRVRTKSLPGLTWEDLEELVAGGNA